MNRNNNFDLLRLLFASAVIISHSPLLIDGDDSEREPLRSIFGSVDLGFLAVEGFFLISGYLVTKSYEDSDHVQDYLLKRILRIYPGFLVAYFVSFFLVGSLGGGDVPRLDSVAGLGAVAHALALHAPEVPNAFADLPIPSVNGSMWTVAYEFRCYLLVIFCGALSLLRHRVLLASVTAVLLGLSVLKLPIELPHLIGVAVSNG